MKQRILLTVVGLLAAGLLALPAHAQSGKIAGRVVEQGTGEPLPGVNIVVVEKIVNGEAVPAPEPQGAATGPDGYYTILNVGPGLYNVRASFIGFTPVTKTGVQVSSGFTTELSFTLSEEVYEGDEVTVVAERDVVQADVAGTVEFIQPQRMTEAPTTRVDEFVSKMKGIELVSNDEGQGLSVRGGSIRETDIRIDGNSLRDPRSGNAYTNFNTLAVEEVQVVTGGFEARHGNLQSGLVNVVTREGSRDRFTASMRVDYAPAGQRRFFGKAPWEPGSPLYEVYGGQFALEGVPDSLVQTPENPNGWVPNEDMFAGFRGWNDRRTGVPGLTGEENRALWNATHPSWEVATRPDYFVESAFTGPFILPKTSFLLAVRYEDTHFGFPIGPRDSYTDLNAQLKLTTRLTPASKLSANFMVFDISTINVGSTSNYGGALTTRTDRFNFLTNTQSSVRLQAAQIGGSGGFANMYNIGRTQFFDRREYIGGLKWTQTLSDKTFFTVEAAASYADNTVAPFLFSTEAPGAYLEIGDQTFLNLPAGGAPNGQATPIDDLLGMFTLSGGANASDSSYSWSANLRGDLTTQLTRHHQLDAGFSVNYDHVFVYSGINRSNEFAFEPGLFQYYTATPIDAALYVQDKLEYEGVVATVGVRAEYFNPMRDGFEVGLPLDEDFRDVYGEYYQELPGALNSYERWVAWRATLENPPGWPTKEVKGDFRLSPRIGASFPITSASKLYFNYGTMYQRPKFGFMYNLTVQGIEANVPAPGLDPEKTTMVEFGYEQSFFNNYVLNATFYYKDVQNRPLSVSYFNYDEDVIVHTYSTDLYRDIRGIELRAEKNRGRFFTFWANYTYQIESSGQLGLADIYENPLKADQQQRDPNISRAQPRPRAYVSTTFKTPTDFGFEVLGNQLFGGWRVNPLFEWRDGGYINLTPDEPNPDKQQRLDVVDYTNTDLRVSKVIRVPTGQLQLVLTVDNLFNQKRLTTSNMLPGQLSDYRNSLRHQYKSDELKGDDKWGEWDADHIDVGWYTAPIFLNPRRILLGLRYEF